MSDHLNFKQLESAALKAWKPVKEGLDNLKPAARDFGRALIALRAECRQRGQFMEWLRKNHIDENRAMYCLRLAQGKVKPRDAPKDKPEDEEPTLAPGSGDSPVAFPLTLELPAVMHEELVRLAKTWGDNDRLQDAALHLMELGLEQIKTKPEEAA